MPWCSPARRAPPSRPKRAIPASRCRRASSAGSTARRRRTFRSASPSPAAPGAKPSSCAWPTPTSRPPLRVARRRDCRRFYHPLASSHCWERATPWRSYAARRKAAPRSGALPAKTLKRPARSSPNEHEKSRHQARRLLRVQWRTPSNEQVSKALVCLWSMFVAQPDPRSTRGSRLAHPALAVGMKSPAALGRHGAGARPVQQAGVRDAAIGVDAAIAGDDLVPGRLAPGAGVGIGERRAIDLALVEVDHDLVAVLDEGDRAAEGCFRADMADDEAD